MTEEEEDMEMLSDLNTAKKNVISFDESPAYIKVKLSSTKLINLFIRHPFNYAKGCPVQIAAIIINFKGG